MSLTSIHEEIVLWESLDEARVKEIETKWAAESEDRIGLVTAFLDEIEVTLNRVLRHSTRGIRYLHEQDAVEHIASPFGLIYQIRTDEILITSVMDLRRDPVRAGHSCQYMKMFTACESAMPPDVRRGFAPP
jgi:hypothetical protein